MIGNSSEADWLFLIMVGWSWLHNPYTTIYPLVKEQFAFEAMAMASWFNH